VAGKSTLGQVPDAAGGHPVTLVVSVKQFAVDKTEPSGRAHAHRPGFHYTLGADFQGPATPGYSALPTPPFPGAKGDIGGDEHAAAFGNLRTVGILMVVRRQWPGVHGLVDICLAVAAGVLQAG